MISRLPTAVIDSGDPVVVAFGFGAAGSTICPAPMAIIRDVSRSRGPSVYPLLSPGATAPFLSAPGRSTLGTSGIFGAFGTSPLGTSRGATGAIGRGGTGDPS